MPAILNVYCDESCHLEHDRQSAMAIGAVWCPLDRRKEISLRLREIQAHHGMSPTYELKWTKVSPAKLEMYSDIMDYFFDDDHLHFRALVVPDKSALDHAAFGQSHDDWYYKIYFDMLKAILSPDARYRIYLDVKDTRSARKVKMLHDVLCNNMYDFSREIIEDVQSVRSHESVLVQLADFLVGCVHYANRGQYTSAAKEALVRQMRRRSGYRLTQTTLYREQKVNLLIWRPTEVRT